MCVLDFSPSPESIARSRWAWWLLGWAPVFVLSCPDSDPFCWGRFPPLSPAPDKIRVFRAHAGFVFFCFWGICGILACGHCLTWNQQIGILEPRSSGLPKRNLPMPTRHGHASAPPSLLCMRIAVYQFRAPCKGAAPDICFSLSFGCDIAWLGLPVNVSLLSRTQHNSCRRGSLRAH